MSYTGGHILILGAGLMQRPALEAARSLGCRVSVVDANPNAVCVPLADYFKPIDLKDAEAIRDVALRLKEEEGLCGVFTAGTDFSASVSYAAEACGFSAHSYEAALNASDKLRMRRCFKMAGVPSPHFLQADSSNMDSICLTADRLGEQLFPLVVKPVDNMGGRGCRLIRSRPELEPALEAAMANSRSGRAILEDYIEGPEFSIDALVYDGSVTICGFADRHIFFQPYFIEMGHTMPTSIGQEEKVSLAVAFAKGIKALGLTCGAAKADIKMTRKGPMIGEIAARLSGGYMSGWTFPYASSFPLTEQAERIALGMTPESLLAMRVPIDTGGLDVPFALYEIPVGNVCAERAWISVPGRIASVYGISSAADCDAINDVFPRVGVGSDVVFPHNNVEKCGNVVATAGARSDAVSAAENAVSNILLRLQVGCDATDIFLSRSDERNCTEGFPPDAYDLPEEVGILLRAECGDTSLSVEEPVADKIPACLIPFLDTLRDWNHRTLRNTIELYDSLRPEVENDGSCREPLPYVSAYSFWRACIRGGIQGMLYIMDSASHGAQRCIREDS